MEHSEIVEGILEHAEKLRQENGVELISATLIVAAVSDIQAQKYRGSEGVLYPERYEEERLRLLYEKTYRLHASRSRYLIKEILSFPEILDIPFDTDVLYDVQKTRGRVVLTADTLFLKALEAIPGEHRGCLPQFKNELDVIWLLEQADKEIFDYVIRKNEEICAKLNKIISEAKALRDWRPKEKLAEPEALFEELNSKIECEYKNNVLRITVPEFFTHNDLVIAVHKAEDIYYLSDEGCATGNLINKGVDKDKIQEILNKTVSEPCVINGCITAITADIRRIFRFIQHLIFIANGDMYADETVELIYNEKSDRRFVPSDEGEDFDYKCLIDEIKGHYRFRYTENDGVYLSVSTTYALFSCTVAFALECADDAHVKISDARKGKTEGEALEAFYWDHNDITPYLKYFEGISAPFGVIWENKNPYASGEKRDWVKILFRFINLAVVLSEMGHCIEPRKE